MVAWATVIQLPAEVLNRQEEMQEVPFREIVQVLLQVRWGMVEMEDAAIAVDG